MNYKDFFTLMIIFLLVLTLGLRVAEQGVYSTMGIETRPRTFDLDFNKNGVYNINLLGKNIELNKIYKIGELDITDRWVTLKFLDRQIQFCPVISLPFPKW